MDIQKINHVLVSAIGRLQEGELDNVVAPLEEESLSGRARVEDVVLDPGNRKVALAVFTPKEGFVEFSSPDTYVEKLPLATVAKFYLGWVPHRQGQSLKKLGIKSSVLKKHIPPSAMPKPEPAKNVFGVPKKGQTAMIAGDKWKVVSVGKKKSLGMFEDVPFYDVKLKSGSKTASIRYFTDDGKVVDNKPLGNVTGRGVEFR